MAQKTTLSQVQRALKKNKKVALIASRVDSFGQGFDWTDDPVFIIRLFVAPVEKTKDVGMLQKILISLVPEMTPNFQQNVKDGGRFMVLGRLVFVEIIGQKVVVSSTKIRQADIKGMEGFIKQKCKASHQQPLHRAIEIRLFPTEALAKAAAESGRYDESMEWTEINEFH